MIFELLKFGFFYGCFIGLIALGFSLIYNILHIIDFAHTDRLVIAGYAYIISLNYFNHFISIVIAIACAVIFAVISEVLIYKIVRKKNPKLLLLTTFGLSIIIQNTLAIFFSDNTMSYPFSEHSIGDTHLYLREMALVPLLLLLCVSLFLWLKNTRAGLSLRASISNYEKSLTLGLNPNKLSIIIFIFSGIIAGLGGVYLSMDSGISPYSGFKLMILAFSSCLVAGLDNVYGSVLIGILCGILLNLFQAIFSSLSAELMTLLVLLIMLLIFPRGIFGKHLRVI